MVVMKSLSEFSHVGYSQSGEEGIIAEILRRIGVEQGWFVEFGAVDGKRLSNTFALVEKGWSGLYIEGNPLDHADLLKNMQPFPKVRTLTSYVTCEAGNDLDTHLRTAGVPDDFDLLSIDIDSNDYWVWKSSKCRPKIVIIEYNCHHDITVSKSVVYDPDPRQGWTGNDYYGASAKALVDLGQSKGYVLVYHHTDTNLFFVREEFAALFEPWPISKIRQLILYPPADRKMIDVSLDTQPK